MAKKSNKKNAEEALNDQAIKEEQQSTGEKPKRKLNPVAEVEKQADKDAEIVEGVGNAQIDAGDQANEVALAQSGADTEAQVPAEVVGMKVVSDSKLKTNNSKQKSKSQSNNKKQDTSNKSQTNSKSKFKNEKTETEVKEPVQRVRSKKYKNVLDKSNTEGYHKLEEAVKLVKSLSYTKFDGTVELHVRLVAKKKSDDINVRGTINLPSGSPKEKNIVIADDNIIDEISKGKTDFDILLATPETMPKLARVAKVLGPKGKMPSPKSGTVTDDPEKTKKELSGGLIEYRTDAHGNVHVAVGKVSWDDVKLIDNIKAVLSVLPQKNIISISIAASMSPSVKVKI